jgi:hypothetical protein
VTDTNEPRAIQCSRAADARGHQLRDHIGQAGDPGHVAEHEEQRDVAAERRIRANCAVGVDDLAELVVDRLVERADQRADADRDRDHVARAQAARHRGRERRRRQRAEEHQKPGRADVGAGMRHGAHRARNRSGTPPLTLIDIR